MKTVNTYPELERLGFDGPLDAFIKAASDNRTNTRAMRSLKDGLKLAEENFLSWQKTEALGMINSNEQPVASEMTVSGRLAIEIAKAKNKFIPPNAQTLEGVRIKITTEAMAALEAAVTPLASGAYLPVRKVFHDLFKEPFRIWLKENTQSTAAFRQEHGNTTIIVDKLSEDGKTIAPRLTSPEFERKEAERLSREELRTFLSNGIHTRTEVQAPVKASFRKRSFTVS